MQAKTSAEQSRLAAQLAQGEAAEAQRKAQEAQARAAQLEAQLPQRTVLVEGFTDSTGTAAHNQELSERRAEIVLSDDSGKIANR